MLAISVIERSGMKKTNQYSEVKEREKVTISVSEMGKILGLKKTEAYRLVHKNCFETVLVKGIMRVKLGSFESWYENQTKHKKVDGTPPGQKLREMSYSVSEVAKLLQITTDTVYELIKKKGIETFEAEGWKRIRKDVFEAWYSTQSRFRTAEDRKRDADMEEKSITLSQMAALLGITRSDAYLIVNAKRNAGVFEIVTIAERKRVTKDSFEKWYSEQERYHKVQKATSGLKRDLKETNLKDDLERERLLSTDQSSFTVKDTALLLGVPAREVYRMIEKEALDSFRLGKMIRISRSSIEWWLSPQDKVFREEDIAWHH